MASEYLQWLARNEKPEEKRELTPKEKWKNWWHYHKWHVVIVLAAVLFVAALIRDVVRNINNEPDYQLAYIGTVSLPDETVAALEEALAELGEDRTGDGRVLVQVNQYLVDDKVMGYAAQVQLWADAENCDSFVFLMEDPVQVQEKYEILAYPDGTAPEEGSTPSEDLWYSWAECPVLMERQPELSELYVARRVVRKDSDKLEGDVAFWETLTAGAE